MTSPVFTNKIRIAYSAKEKELRHKARLLLWQLAGGFVLCMLSLLMIFRLIQLQFIATVTVASFLIIGVSGYLFYRWGKNYGKVQSELKKLRISSTIHEIHDSVDPDDPFLYFRRD